MSVASVRLAQSSDHFSPNRGFAAVWGKVVLLPHESHARSFGFSVDLRV